MDGKRPTPGRPINKAQVAPRTISAADRTELFQILREAGRGGSALTTSHFRMRGAQRGFTTVDALNALRRGAVVGGPEFCPEFCNWKMTVKLEDEDDALTIIAAVCAGECGQVWSRDVHLVTGFIRKLN